MVDKVVATPAALEFIAKPQRAYDFGKATPCLGR